MARKYLPWFNLGLLLCCLYLEVFAVRKAYRAMKLMHKSCYCGVYTQYE